MVSLTNKGLKQQQGSKCHDRVNYGIVKETKVALNVPKLFII